MVNVYLLLPETLDLELDLSLLFQINERFADLLRLWLPFQFLFTLYFSLKAFNASLGHSESLIVVDVEAWFLEVDLLHGIQLLLKMSGGYQCLVCIDGVYRLQDALGHPRWQRSFCALIEFSLVRRARGGAPSCWSAFLVSFYLETGKFFDSSLSSFDQLVELEFSIDWI